MVGFRPNFPEISPNNKSFSALMNNSSTATMINPLPSINLQENDLLVIKHRVSAFSGSDLEIILRSQNIKHLILTGIATSGVVLSTLREAADKDYQLTVLSDLSADFDPEIQTVLIEKVFPKQADVITSDDWLKEINKH